MKIMYEGAYGTVHAEEVSALSERILSAGQGKLAAVMRTDNKEFEPAICNAILRAAEIIKSNRGI